jgi:hypothetical protein
MRCVFVYHFWFLSGPYHWDKAPVASVRLMFKCFFSLKIFEIVFAWSPPKALLKPSNDMFKYSLIRMFDEWEWNQVVHLRRRKTKKRIESWEKKSTTGSADEGKEIRRESRKSEVCSWREKEAVKWRKFQFRRGRKKEENASKPKYSR